MPLRANSLPLLPKACSAWKGSHAVRDRQRATRRLKLGISTQRDKIINTMKHKSIWESLEKERKRKAKAKFLKALRKDPTLIYGVLVMFGEATGKDLTQIDPEDINGIFLTLAKIENKDTVIGIGIGKHQIKMSFEELIELIEEVYQDKITNILKPPSG
jgi:ribosomal protein S21